MVPADRPPGNRMVRISRMRQRQCSGLLAKRDIERPPHRARRPALVKLELWVPAAKNDPLC